MNAQKDIHNFACISVIKTCVTGLVLKDKNAISHSCSEKLSSYFHKSVFSVKSRLIFNAFYYRHATQKFVHTKINTYSNEMNAQKDFHIFTCISVIKTCVTGLVLKDKNAQKLLKVFFIFLANCFNVLMIIFKKSQAYRRL